MALTFKPLPSKSTRQIQEYVDAVEKGMDNYFVIQNNEGWYVKKASSSSNRAKLFESKSDAIKDAKKKAAKKNSEILVFDSKGSLLLRESAH